MPGKQSTPRKRPGRPPKPARERKRSNFTFRVRDDLRRLLEDGAAENGRSVSEEIEAQLERSYLEKMARYRELGPPHIAAAAKMLANVLSSLEEITDRQTFGELGDPFLHSQAWRAMNQWFLATRPPGDEKPPEKEVLLIPEDVIPEMGPYLMRDQLRYVRVMHDPALPEKGHIATEAYASAQLLKEDSKSKGGKK